MVRKKIFIYGYVESWTCEVGNEIHSITDVLIVAIHKRTIQARGYHFVKEQSFIYKCHNCGKQHQV